jgi:ABC-type glycerol-3-phosphate transport system substrate-binding protein
MPIKLSQKQLIIIGGGVVLVIAIFILVFLNFRLKANTSTQTKLIIWGTEAPGGVMALASAYPYGKVSYVQVDSASYHAQLLAALAAGTGPDVFEINNRDLPQWKPVLSPFPTSSTAFGLLQLGQLFPDVVAQDFVSGGRIYGLPLSIDTLAMIYNKDLLNSAGIAILPATWDDFDADVAKLRSVNAQGQLDRSGAAIGGSSASIPNEVDILSLLMLQNGTQMTGNTFANATFASADNGGKGPAAFNFYLQFANIASPYYTWNDGLGSALTSFVNGKTAIIFGYQADLASITEKAPFLNIGIAPMPQAKGASVAVNYPNYNGFVAAKAGHTADAWNLIFYLTAAAGNGRIYSGATGKPPALRTDIAADVNDPALSVFASQVLTARSWYEVDSGAIDGILNGAIQSVLNGAQDPLRALTTAETAVTQLMNHP